MLPLLTPTLAAIPVTLLSVSFVVVSLFMMLVILIQKPKGGGLSGAFGGAGGGETSFVGAKIGDFLTYLTVGCFVAFLLLAMGLTWTINPAQNQIKNDNVTSSQTENGESADDQSDADDAAGDANAGDQDDTESTSTTSGEPEADESEAKDPATE